MGAIYILWLRELKRYVRSRVQIVVSLGQPCLYLLALGSGSVQSLGRPDTAAICSLWPRGSSA